MGKNKDNNRRVRRRRFGQACGKQSKKFKECEQRRLKRQEEQCKKFRKDKHVYLPYKIVRKQCFKDGKMTTKVTVRRIKVSLHKNKKLLQVGDRPLRFQIQQDLHSISGYRIMNLELLKNHICTISAHCCMCIEAQELVAKGSQPIVLKSEIKRCGLFSVIKVCCNGCGKEFPIETSFKQSSGLYDVNVRAVWGAVTSGCGPSNLNEILNTIDIPGLNEQKFTKMEQDIGNWWHQCMQDEMSKAANEEKRIAIEKNSYHEGIPAITVICDGGWSKRTHKHTYNAAGGVAVIFGAETKKLLYVGVRNKYCVVCRRAENLNEPPKEHNCYSNWNESSQAMEADIILNGFLTCEAKYGVRYLKIIADGDSSVYSTLQENVPVWGKDITKLECANHICKCLRTNLEKLVCEKPQYKGKGKLTKINRVRLTTAIRCAIKMRTKTKDVKQLKKDILNSVYHILGFHSRCSDFCKKTKQTNAPSKCADNDDSFDDTFDSIFEQQYNFWKEPCEEDIENSRNAVKNQVSLSELKELITDVQIILNRIGEKSNRLIGNFTTNIAESWMAIRAKFDGGKVVNRCSRGSWETRCYGGALRKNLGPAWSPLTFQTVTNTRAGVHFHNGAKRISQKLQHAKKYKENPQNKEKRRKRKLKESSQSVTKKAKKSYGSNLDDTPDIIPTRLHELCTNFVDKNFQKNKQELDCIERQTVEQSKSEQWKKERKLRLTSSFFGRVMKRRSNNCSSKLVKSILYPSFTGNIHTIRGLAEESNTIIEYSNLKGNVKIDKAGFKICSNHQFLGASTDGLVLEGKEHGLLEIKNFLQNNQLLIKEATYKVPNFCLENKENIISLKTNHEIYFQIQGQLNIYDVDWCDFVLRRTNPYDIHIERIFRDKQLWENDMVPKLVCFYEKFMLPELAHPRYGTYTGIREPEKPWYDNPTLVKEKKGGTRTSGEKTHQRRTSTEKTQQTSSVTVQSSSSTRPETVNTRSKRQRTVKFLGRHITHEWLINEDTGETKWYAGLVTDVVRGRDGDRNAVYQIQYDGEDGSFEVDDLQKDYSEGSVNFKDL